MRKNYMALFTVVILLGVVMAVGCGGGGGGGDGASPVAPVVSGDGLRADLSGTVTYLGQPVPNASVFLLAPTGNPQILGMRAAFQANPAADPTPLTADGSGYQATTNPQGQYLFSQVPVGTYTLLAMATPNTQISQSVVVGAIQSLDLALKPTGTLTGKVVWGGPKGDPVIGEFLFLQGTSYIGITGGDGSFSLQNIPISSTPYTLVPAEQSSYGFRNSPILVSPVAGVATSVGTLEMLSFAGAIQGVALIGTTTTDSSQILTRGTSTFGSSVSTFTMDAAGNFQLLRVPFGNIKLTYEKSVAGTMFYAEQTVAVTSLATVTAPTVTMQPITTLKGEVVVGVTGLVPDQYGNFNYTYFSLYNQSEGLVDSGTAYGNSSDTFPYVTPDSYWVKWTNPNNDYVLLNAIPGTTDQVAAKPVVAGASTTFVLQLGFKKAKLTVTANPVDADFPSLEYVTLYKNGAYVTDNSFTISGATGTVVFSSLATGTYSIVMATSTYYQGASVAVTLNPGDQVTRNLPLTCQVARISGYVSGVDADHPTYIRLWKDGGSTSYYQYFSSDSSYNFEVTSTGTYSVAVDTNTGYDIASFQASLPGGAVVTQNFNLVPSYPVITSASFDSPGTTLSIGGQRFGATNGVVRIDGSIQTINSWSDTAVTVDSTAVAPGIHSVTIQQNGGFTSAAYPDVPKQFPAGPTVTSTLADVQTRSFTLKWTALPSAESYTVSGSGGAVGASDLTGTSYTFTDLTPDTDYTFTVQASATGLSLSPSSATNTHTLKVFDDYSTITSALSLGGLYKTQIVGGYLYGIGNVNADGSGNCILFRWNLANPADLVQVNLTTTHSIVGARDLFVGSAVYVAYSTDGMVGRVAQFDLATLVKSASEFTAPSYSSSLDVLSVLEVGANVFILTAGDTLNSADLFRQAPGGLTTALSPDDVYSLPSGLNGHEWEVFTDQDGTPHIIQAWSFNGGNIQNYYQIFDGALTDITTPEDKVFLTDSPASIAGGQGGYFAVQDGTLHRVLNFNTGKSFSRVTGEEGQSTVLANGKSYCLIPGDLGNLFRFSENGADLGTTGLRGVYDGWYNSTSSLQSQHINYDSTKDQVVVVSKSSSGVLQAVLFPTAE